MEKEPKDLKEQNKKVAETYAKSRGYNDINEITDKAREMIKSDDVAQRQLGMRLAQETVQDLLLLCLNQELMDNPLPNYMNLTERVFDEYMRNGNAKEYVADLDTGVSTYLDTQFIPDAQTLQQLEKYFIQIYDSEKTLNPKAYQFKKQQTIPVNEWLPYFMSGELNRYIQYKQDSLNRAYKIYIYNKLCTIITDPLTGKTINGSATNLFDAVLELAPHIDRMYQYNATYNAQQTSKLMYAAKPEDILIFTSTEIRSMLMNGIKSQVFNANFVGDSHKSFNYDNLKFLGNKITQGDSNTINEDSGTEWIDDNTIIVLDISRIKHIIQVDQSSTQSFASNLTEYISKDIWGAMDILPWCKKLIYKNNNLKTIPSQVK